MNERQPLPSIDTLKSQAKRLRAELGSDGIAVSHGKALELVAHQHGFKDWNTVAARAKTRPAPCPARLGERVRGRYLTQPFEGQVIGVRALGETGWFRVTFDFDRPVDVVTFDSFSAYRRRVTCTIDRRGRTAEKTSDGRPHLQLSSP